MDAKDIFLVDNDSKFCIMVLLGSNDRCLPRFHGHANVPTTSMHYPGRTKATEYILYMKLEH